MARPQKNNLDYFSHDKDMRNDIKIRNLRRKFSHKGYSVYVMMLEHLSDCEYLQYEWNELSIELLVPDFDIDAEELVDIVNHCIKLKLFELELGILYCPKFYDRNSKVLTDRNSFDLNNSRLSQLKQDLLSKSEINYSFPSESTYSIVKDSIVKKSKEKDSIVEESKEQDSKLKEYQRTMLKDVINSMSVPDDIKYSFKMMVDGASTPSQRDRVFEYETTLNKIPGIKQFLQTIKD
jgi:hypothetical protein